MKITKEELLFFRNLMVEFKHKIQYNIKGFKNNDLYLDDGIHLAFWCPISKIKPAVISISNITQTELEFLYNNFCDMMLISSIEQFSDIILIDCAGNLDTLPLRVCKELAKMNYDIFGWLENDLAVELSCS